MPHHPIIISQFYVGLEDGTERRNLYQLVIQNTENDRFIEILFLLLSIELGDEDSYIIFINL